MYKGLLEGVYHFANVLGGALEQAGYLSSLTQSAKRLSKRLRLHPPDARFFYRNQEVRDVYLLRYFPFYCGLLPQVFWQSGIRLQDKRCFIATFFACGPAPELIGLLRYMAGANSNLQIVKANLVDRASDNWTQARDIAKNYVVPRIWNGELTITPVNADLENKGVSPDIRKKIARSNLVVFQNFLNEIKDWTTTEANILKILRLLSPGAIGVIIDHDKPVDTTVDRLNHLLLQCQNSRSRSIEIVGKSNELGRGTFNCRRLFDGIPEIITDNLFYVVNNPGDFRDDGLALRAEIDYVFLVFKKIHAPT